MTDVAAPNERDREIPNAFLSLQAGGRGFESSRA